MSWAITVLVRAESNPDWRKEFQDLLKKFSILPREIRILSEHAEEWDLDEIPESFPKAARSYAASSKVDVVLQKNDTHRRKRLVIFDMDSTLIQNECIDMIAAYAGVEPQVAAITESAMRGELDFAQSLAARVKLLKGVPTSVYDELKKRIQITPGANTLIRVLRSHGVKTAVLSGGFIPLASWLRDQLGLDYAFANTLEEVEGKLTGRTVGRIIDGTAKAELLKEIASKEGIDLVNTAAVGDGSNDLAMMAEAGIGIAFSAKPLVQDRASAAVNTGNLADLLYIFGY